MIKIFNYPEWYIPWGLYIAKYVNGKPQILLHSSYAVK